MAITTFNSSLYINCTTCKNFGFSAADIGDFDGNGYHDFAIGDSDLHDVYILLITAAGIVNFNPASFTGVNGGLKLTCSTGFELAAWITGIGDVDGDGYDDLAVGDYRANIVRIVFGGSENSNFTDMCLTNARVLTINAASGRYFGYPIVRLSGISGHNLTVGIGDQGSNKFHLLFAPKLFRNTSFYIENPPAEIEVTTITAPIDGLFSATATLLKDIDKDGFNDLAIGAPQAQTVYAVRGKANFASFDVSVLNDSNNGAIISSTGKYFGSALNGIGDFDGDGCVDIAVGDLKDQSYTIISTKCNFTGLSAHKLKVKFKSPVAAGFRIAALSDINEDGFDDVAFSDYGKGIVIVLQGGKYTSDIEVDTSKDSEYWSIIRINPQEVTSAGKPGFGYFITKISDATGDMCPDLLITAPINNMAAVIPGECHTHRGHLEISDNS